MPVDLEKSNNSKVLVEIVSFIRELDKLSLKKEIGSLLLNEISLLLSPRFSSFVEKENDVLKVICQTGESDSVKNAFSNKMCLEIFDWVMNQKQLTSLKLSEKGQFVFIPILDQIKSQNIEHGILVIYIGDSGFEFSKELNTTVNIMCKLAVLSLTKSLRISDSEKYIRLQEQIKSELTLTAKLQKAVSGSEINKKMLISVLEDEGTGFNGNVWWINELSADISLVLMAEVLCKGSPSAMLSGYLLGEMNSLKSRAEISLKPQEVLKYLNQQLNPIFKSTGITVNAWYGVFNAGAKKIRFANANHPDPYIVGPEQQVSNLILSISEKGKPLGINLDSIFTESCSDISSGSKLIICTRELLEQAAKIGDRYDPTWFPQVLETIGTLSLSEMRNSLESILSENAGGTAKAAPRLALLLEIPS
ncbi:MAG: SpoIIE family protein phosphatase [Candidatus Melainabacteria bacterium]|nr:SpoIIE family protein phosphatase [Candidatus Melainabacteria bacterium]